MAVKPLCLAAPAKINLYLKIIGRRPDGYHELDSLMQKLALFDRLELSLADETGVHLSCPGTDLAEDKENIVHRAASLFLGRTGNSGQGVRIVLRKNIPVAAGLGGGSSDAAAVLLGLDRLLAAGRSRQELAAMGLVLGADVPFFVFDGAAAWARGVGEELAGAVSLHGYRVLLVNPGIPVSTKWAYETFALTSGENIFNLSSSQKEYGCNDSGPSFCKRLFQPEDLCNDLEAVASEKYSAIGKIKEKMLTEGAAGSMMSGSGSTVFGLFAVDALTQAEHCRNEFKKEYDQVYLVDPLV